MRNKKLKVLIGYDYFPPAQKSGGITRSLTYLIHSFAESYDFYVLCSAFDLGERQKMTGIEVEKWQDYQGKAKVMYVESPSMQRVKSLIHELSPEVVYINGIFSPAFNLYPLLLASAFRNIRFVVAPRGMLQEGALKVKALKKQVFLKLFKLFGLHKNLVWHATDRQEEQDILRLMSPAVEVILAEDTPDLHSYERRPISKKPGALKLVFISLLTAKKNLKYLLQKLPDVVGEVYLDIYGPVKDAAYWQECEAIIRQVPGHIRVNYRGAIHPDQVVDTLGMYHFLVLPTLGENFGHAIYEALNAGRPVIISDRTPWRHLQRQQAGWDFPLEEKQALPAILEQCVRMDQGTYDAYCQGAQAVARRYVAEAGFEEKYQRLFGAQPDVGS